MASLQRCLWYFRGLSLLWKDVRQCNGKEMGWLGERSWEICGLCSVGGYRGAEVIFLWQGKMPHKQGVVFSSYVWPDSAICHYFVFCFVIRYFETKKHKIVINSWESYCDINKWPYFPTSSNHGYSSLAKGEGMGSRMVNLYAKRS